jgi:hypothetical protein
MRSPNSRHGRHRIRQFSRAGARPAPEVAPIEPRIEEEETRLQAHLDRFESRVRAARYGRIVDEPARAPRGERGMIID